MYSLQRKYKIIGFQWGKRGTKALISVKPVLAHKYSVILSIFFIVAFTVHKTNFNSAFYIVDLN
jgi:hypothetical protein